MDMKHCNNNTDGKDISISQGEEPSAYASRETKSIHNNGVVIVNANQTEILDSIADESDTSEMQLIPNINGGAIRRLSTTKNKRGKRLRAMSPTEVSSASSDISSDYIVDYAGQSRPQLATINAATSRAEDIVQSAESPNAHKQLELVSNSHTCQKPEQMNSKDDNVSSDNPPERDSLQDHAEDNLSDHDEHMPVLDIAIEQLEPVERDSDNSDDDNEPSANQRILGEYFNRRHYVYDSHYDGDHWMALSSSDYPKYDPTPDTLYPRPEWQTCKTLRDRRLGLNRMNKGIGTRSHQPFWFERYACDSLFFIQRLIVSDKLREHNGCVNCINFNKTGNLLCSGSDDVTICIWDWQRNKLKKKLFSDHDENIFQCHWYNDDTNIITSSRDGTVRLLDVNNEKSNLLFAQREEIGCLAFSSPTTIVTCSLDASVHEIDLRTHKERKLFVVKTPNSVRICRLHTINSHPIDRHKLLVAGKSPYIYLYDSRMLKKNAQDEVDPLTTFCPQDLRDTKNIVTSVAYNSIGSKILASYNDEDLYVFDSNTYNCEHKYCGHRNLKTIKSCLWFGDNFVLSGSDDGYIYGWDVDSEHIVCSSHGDKSGAVNSLAMHPTMPVLAASGLDHDVKILTPTSPQWPQTLKGIKERICNNMYKRQLKGRPTGIIISRSDDDSEADDTDTDMDRWIDGDDDDDDESDDDSDSSSDSDLDDESCEDDDEDGVDDDDDDGELDPDEDEATS